MRKVSRSYGPVVALSELELAVMPGECVALIGHNGSGKTTATRIAAGYLTPTQGKVFVGGVDIHGDDKPERARAQLAYVADNPVLYEDLTIVEHLELIALAHGESEDLDGRIEELLGDLGLAERAEFVPAQLSRGMRQKAQIACAFIRPFKVILLDEPVAGLDPPSQRALRERLLATKRDGGAVLITTHQLDFSRGLADRAVVLEAGRVVADGPYAKVIASPEVARLGLM